MNKGDLILPIKVMSMRSPPQWRKTLIITQKEACRGAADAGWEPPPNWANASDTVACPTCLQIRSIKGATLRNRTGFAYIRCKVCKTRSRSVRWDCDCSMPWYQCSTHAILLPHVVEEQRKRSCYPKALKKSKKKSAGEQESPNNFSKTDKRKKPAQHTEDMQHKWKRWHVTEIERPETLSYQSEQEEQCQEVPNK